MHHCSKLFFHTASCFLNFRDYCGAYWCFLGVKNWWLLCSAFNCAATTPATQIFSKCNFQFSARLLFLTLPWVLDLTLTLLYSFVVGVGVCLLICFGLFMLSFWVSKIFLLCFCACIVHCTYLKWINTI